MISVKKKVLAGTKLEISRTKNPRGRPKQIDIDRVLDIAVKAYWNEGPAQASLNSICAHANVSKPSVYRQFGNEDGLTCAALERYTNLVFTQIAEILNRDDNFTLKLNEIIQLVSFDQKWEIGCLFVKMRADKTRLGPKTQAKIAELEIIYLDLCTRFLETNLASCPLARKIPIDIAAKYMSLQIGQAYSLRASGETSVNVHAILSLALSIFLQSDTLKDNIPHAL